MQTKENTIENTKSSSLLPQRISNLELSIIRNSVQAKTVKKPLDAVIDYNMRSEVCMNFLNVIDFVLSVCNSTIVYVYLAVFEYDVAPKTWQAIAAFFGIRILLSFAASLAIMIGLRQELAKVLL